MDARGTITRREWLLSARRRLAEADVAASHLVAQVLLAHVVEAPREHVIAYDELALTDAQLSEAEALLSRRVDGTPLAYLIEAVEFYGHRLRVTPDVLIPRNETEHLVEFVLSQLAPTMSGDTRPWTLVDIGTGSACLPIAIGLSDPRMRAVAIDISESALAVAADNVFLHGLEDRVALLAGDRFAPLRVAAHEPEATGACLQRMFGRTDLRGHVDFVVSNPPYIDPALTPTLRREVLSEPHVALFAGEAGAGGTAVLTTLLDESRAWLRPGGWLVMELGIGQADALRAHASGLKGWRLPADVRPDLAGIDRVFAIERATD